MAIFFRGLQLLTGVITNEPSSNNSLSLQDSICQAITHAKSIYSDIAKEALNHSYGTKKERGVTDTQPHSTARHRNTTVTGRYVKPNDGGEPTVGVT